MPKGSPPSWPRLPATRAVCLRRVAVLLLSLLFVAGAHAQLTLNRYISAGNTVVDLDTDFVSSLTWTNNGFTNISSVSVNMVLSSVDPDLGDIFYVGETAAFLSYNDGGFATIYDFNTNNTAESLDATFSVAGPFNSPGVNNAWDVLLANGVDNIGTPVFNYWRLIVTGGAVTNGTIEVGAQGIISASSGYTVSGASISVGTNTGTDAITVTNNGSLTFGGGLTGSGELKKVGSGTLFVGGTNASFSGAVLLNAGSVNLTTTNALGTGRLVQSNGSSTAVFSAGGTYTQNMSLYNASFANGSNTLSGSITNNGSGIFTGASGTTNTISGAVSGTGGFTKEGSGRIVLAGSANNTYTGATVVNAGSLVLSNSSGNAIGSSSSIQVNSGGTLVLGASNQIGDSVGLILSGGTFLVGAANVTETLGTLTLNASSTIDFGNFGASGLRQLTFANSSTTNGVIWATNAILTITNWQGVINTSSDFTEIFFGIGGLTTAQQAQIVFANQGNATGGLLGTGELVPVPEPRVYVAALALLGFVGWRERKRIASIIRFGRRS